MSKIIDESILVFSLKILSGSFLHFVGITVFIVGYMRNVNSHFFAKQGILVTQSCEWDESRDNYQAKRYFFSYSALTVMTLQFLVWHFSKLPVASHSQDPVVRNLLNAHS